MKPAEYLDAAKARLNIQSDYELAKRFAVGRSVISMVRNGERSVPLDVAFRVAIVLELDPAQVVADLEGQQKKNPTKRDFWTGFISRAAMLLMAVTCTLAWSFSAISGSAENALFGRRLRPENFA